MGSRSSKEENSISQDSEVSKWRAAVKSTETVMDKVRRLYGQYLIVIPHKLDYIKALDRILGFKTVSEIPDDIKNIPGFTDAVRSLENYNKFHSKEGKYAYLLIRTFVDSEGRKKSDVTMSSSENFNHPATFARRKEEGRIEREIAAGKSPYGGRRKKSTSHRTSKRLRRRTGRASANSRGRSARTL